MLILPESLVKDARGMTRRKEREESSIACVPARFTHHFISFHSPMNTVQEDNSGTHCTLGIAQFQVKQLSGQVSQSQHRFRVSAHDTIDDFHWQLLESGLEVLQELRPHSVLLSALNLYVIHKTYLSYQTISCRLLSASFSAQFTSDHERGTNTTSTRTCAASLHEAALPPELDDNSLNSHILFPTSSRSIRSAWCTTLALQATRVASRTSSGTPVSTGGTGLAMAVSRMSRQTCKRKRFCS